MAVAKTKKAECLNPTTGGRMNIDKTTYDLLIKAISHILKREGALTFTQIIEGVYAYLERRQIKFDGSVEWYAITVKKDMEARRIIEVVKEKGKTLNLLLK